MITEDVQDCAAEQGVSEGHDLRRGLEEKPNPFVEGRSEGSARE